MLNQAVIVGRIVRNPEIRETESGKKVSCITLAVPRSFKNVNGEYDTDFIRCTLWKGIAENTANYCSRGDVVGVKGRIQTRMVEYPDQTKHYLTEVIAEKVSFLSSTPKEEK